MLQGYVDQLTREAATGWAFDPSALGSPQEIAVLVDGVEVGRCMAGEVRRSFRHPLLPAPTNMACGFTYRFEPALSLFEHHAVELRFVTSGAPVPGGQREFRCPAPEPLPLKPIIVASRGRSGTTLLMRALWEHPEISVANAYPFEVKLAAYYASAYRVLAAPYVDLTNEPDFVEIAARDVMIGRNPFHRPGLHQLVGTARTEDIFERVVPNRLAAMIREAIGRFYLGVKSTKRREQLRFFAEKGPLDHELRRGFRMLLGDVREIVMVRDPRDMLCSAKSFWKMSSADALRTVAETADALMAIKAESAADTLIVRYEDLIEQRERTLAAVFAFIGVSPHGDAKPDDLEALRRVHATSRDASASVGRWREDLTQDEVFACLEQCGALMHAFGYADGGPAPDSVPTLTGVRFARLEASQRREIVRLNDLAHAAGARLGQAGIARTVVFAAGGNCAAHIGEGWSAAEAEFRWSAAEEVSLTFPAPRQTGSYIMDLFVAPFLVSGVVERQPVGVSVNGVALGEASLNARSILRCGIPAAALAAATPVTITFHLPGAARPADVSPGSSDDRLLALAFQRLVLIGPLADDEVSETPRAATR